MGMEAKILPDGSVLARVWSPELESLLATWAEARELCDAETALERRGVGEAYPGARVELGCRLGQACAAFWERANEEAQR